MFNIVLAAIGYDEVILLSNGFVQMRNIDLTPSLIYQLLPPLVLVLLGIDFVPAYWLVEASSGLRFLIYVTA